MRVAVSRKIVDRLRLQRERRDDGRRVARVDAGGLDVLHHACDVDVRAVAEQVDVDLDGVLEVAVQQHLVAREEAEHIGDVVRDLVAVDGDAHALPAEHVARAHEDRVADALGDVDGLLDRVRDAVRRERDLQALRGCRRTCRGPRRGPCSRTASRTAGRLSRAGCGRASAPSARRAAPSRRPASRARSRRGRAPRTRARSRACPRRRSRSRPSQGCS